MEHAMKVEKFLQFDTIILAFQKGTLAYITKKSGVLLELKISNFGWKVDGFFRPEFEKGFCKHGCEYGWTLWCFLTEFW